LDIFASPGLASVEREVVFIQLLVRDGLHGDRFRPHLLLDIRVLAILKFAESGSNELSMEYDPYKVGCGRIRRA
jgi:hypothetical protein